MGQREARGGGMEEEMDGEDEENLKRLHKSLGLAGCHGNGNQAGRAADSFRLPLCPDVELSPWTFSPFS